MITTRDYLGNEEDKVAVTPELIAKIIREARVQWAMEGEVVLWVSRKSWDEFLDSVEW